MTVKFFVLGGDRRMDFVRERLILDGHEVTVRLDEAECIILPMPLTQDGRHISNTEINMYEFIETVPKGVPVFAGGELEGAINYLRDESLALSNVVPTVEGAIALAINNTDFTLWQSRCLIIGSGRIGKLLAKYLHSMGAKVTISSRKAEDMAYAKIHGMKSAKTDEIYKIMPEQDIIFNTVPSRVMGKCEIAEMRKDAIIIELASKPYGTDFMIAEDEGISVFLAAGLPGKTAPKTAGEIICQTIYRLYNER